MPSDTKTTADELAAVDRLRIYIEIGRRIAANDLVIPVRTKLGITPNQAVIADLRQTASQCLALLGHKQIADPRR